MSAVIWEATPTARKFHKCSACGRQIRPGEQYQRKRIVSYDVDPYTYKQCAHCTAFVHLYLSDFCPDPYDVLGVPAVVDWEPQTDLACEHKRQWLKRWRDGDDLYPVPTAETVVSNGERAS